MGGSVRQCVIVPVGVEPCPNRDIQDHPDLNNVHDDPVNTRGLLPWLVERPLWAEGDTDAASFGISPGIHCLYDHW